MRLLICLCLPGINCKKEQVLATEERAEEILDAGWDSIEAGDFKTAERNFNASLDAFSHLRSPAGRGRSLLGLATLSLDMSRFPVALDRAREAYKAMAEAFGPENPEATLARSLAGRVLRRLGRFDEALSEHRAALKADEHVFGPEHVEVAGHHVQIGRVLLDQGRFQEAIRSYERALAL